MAGGKARGTLFISGGHEDKEGDKVILHEVARRVGRGKLVITTVASKEPAGTFEEYERLFRALGVRHVYKLDIQEREDARAEKNFRVLDGATAVFFTGGDQLKITSQIGDTPTYERIRDIYFEGGTIVGTSAGASVVCATMLVSGEPEQSLKLGDTVRMAPGLSLLEGVIVDQHFSERGRITRLIAAVTQNPQQLGVGIDEDTAAIIEGDRRMKVLGNGAVYVLDGSTVEASNVAEEEGDQTLSVFNLTVHMLNKFDSFELRDRRPYKAGREWVKRVEQLDANGMKDSSNGKKEARETAKAGAEEK